MIQTPIIVKNDNSGMRGSIKRKQLCINLSSSQIAYLREQAKRRGCTVSCLARIGVESFISSELNELEAPLVVRRGV